MIGSERVRGMGYGITNTNPRSELIGKCTEFEFQLSGFDLWSMVLSACWYLVDWSAVLEGAMFLAKYIYFSR